MKPKITESDLYTSSIILKYGDTEHVRRDVETLRDILNRQGASLLLDVIGEIVGESATKFCMTQDEVNLVRKSLVLELEDAICERT